MALPQKCFLNARHGCAWYTGNILTETSLCPSRFGKSNTQEPSLGPCIKINQSNFLIISLQHSRCAAKLGWSMDFGFLPIYMGTSKTAYNIPPLLGAARASSFVKTDGWMQNQAREQSEGNRHSQHSHPLVQIFCLPNCQGLK